MHYLAMPCQAKVDYFQCAVAASCKTWRVLKLQEMTLFVVQVKDPSKAAHAADADVKELIENRGMEMKKDNFTEAKCDQKRYDQASLKLLQSAYSAFTCASLALTRHVRFSCNLDTLNIVTIKICGDILGYEVDHVC